MGNFWKDFLYLIIILTPIASTGFYAGRIVKDHGDFSKYPKPFVPGNECTHGSASDDFNKSVFWLNVPIIIGLALIGYIAYFVMNTGTRRDDYKTQRGLAKDHLDRYGRPKYLWSHTVRVGYWVQFTVVLFIIAILTYTVIIRFVQSEMLECNGAKNNTVEYWTALGLMYMWTFGALFMSTPAQLHRWLSFAANPGAYVGHGEGPEGTTRASTGPGYNATGTQRLGENNQLLNHAAQPPRNPYPPQGQRPQGPPQPAFNGNPYEYPPGRGRN